MKIFDVEISIYENYHTAESSDVITLNKWFKSTMYKKHVLHIRETQDKEMKATLPAITPSGTFSRRAKSCLIKHSGFIQFDIDGKENPDMDPEQWKPEIIKMGAAMCQLSVSGRGLWGLFRINDTTQHEQHFNAMMDVFAKYGVQIDESCSDVSRLRGYSYDENTLFNPDAPVFKAVREKKASKGIIKTVKRPRNTVDSFKSCLDKIIAGRIDMTDGYPNWFALGCSIASEYGETGRQDFHAISQYHSDYDIHEADKQYDACLKGTGFTIATFYDYCSRFGIHYKEKKTSTEAEKFCAMAKKNSVMYKLRDTFELVDKDDKVFECESFSDN